MLMVDITSNDEPRTSDIPSLEALEILNEGMTGTIVLITHDKTIIEM